MNMAIELLILTFVVFNIISSGRRVGIYYLSCLKSNDFFIRVNKEITELFREYQDNDYKSYPPKKNGQFINIIEFKMILTLKI